MDPRIQHHTWVVYVVSCEQSELDTEDTRIDPYVGMDQITVSHTDKAAFDREVQLALMCRGAVQDKDFVKIFRGTESQAKQFRERFETEVFNT